MQMPLALALIPYLYLKLGPVLDFHFLGVPHMAYGNTVSTEY
jgi:hypothetical protein